MENVNLTAARINRNIVECKYTHLSGSKNVIAELIETLWNVNCILLSHLFFSALELIETLWNVNLVGVGAASVGVAELIETLWNVN